MNICRDVDCPRCGWPETYVEGVVAPERIGCRHCGWVEELATAEIESVRQPVQLNRREARVVAGAMLAAVNGELLHDCATWHGGLGADDCEACNVLVFVRQIAGATPVDHLRP